MRQAGLRLFIQSPGWRDLPFAILNVAWVSALCGIPFSLLINWIAGTPWSVVTQHPWKWLATSCLIGAIFGVSFYLTCGLPASYLKRVTRDFPLAVSRTILIVSSMVGGALGCIIALKCLEFVLHIAIPSPDVLRKLAILDGLVAVVTGLIIGAFTRLQSEKMLREKTLSEAAAKAQTFALQAQINPHFFFNTLNTISALVPIDPGAAQATIGRLADMFRYTLSCSRGDLVSLDDELAFARNYLMLEHARFGKRLTVELPETGSVPGVLLPGLTLQPIVENAVKYGIAKRIEGGTVRVDIDRRNGHCSLSVSNQFDPADGLPNLAPEKIYRKGHALANIRERLQLLFGDRANLDVAVTGEDWVRVTVKVPVGDVRS